MSVDIYSSASGTFDCFKYHLFFLSYSLPENVIIPSNKCDTLPDEELSHDQITSRLRQITGGSRELWRLVKPTIRKHESEDGVLIFDDTLEPKPHSDENTIVGWYFDHSSNRSAKGINILNCIYHNEAISIPVAYEIVQKSQEVTDPKTGKVKFVSEESKNEMMRNMLHVCCQNRLKFWQIVGLAAKKICNTLS